MEKYKIKYSRPSIKHFENLKDVGLLGKYQQLINTVKQNPYAVSPLYEKLVGYEKIYSRRININHRLIYKIEKNTVYIFSMWTHYKYL